LTTLAFATGDRAINRRLGALFQRPRRRPRFLRTHCWSRSAEDCALRKVKDMVFTDFSGNRIELVVRPQNGWRYCQPRYRHWDWPT
jgi:hypothetical protein